MANLENGLQLCPTRIDGAPVLFAHKVNQGQCQDRQRGQYHKCFTDCRPRLFDRLCSFIAH